MCLPRLVLWFILMIASIEYWEAECQSCGQGDPCYILQEGEEPTGDCEPFVHSVGSSLLLTCNSSSTNVADNITNLEWLKDGYFLDIRGLFFRKENLLISDSGNYTCRLSGQTVTSHKVLVGGKPHTIPKPTCISRIWGQYTCSWDKGSNFNLATRYQLKFCYQQGSDVETCRDTTGANSCTIDTNMKGAGYHVSVCAENCLGQAESSLLAVDPHDQVLTPFPPSNVTLVPVSSKSMNVTFDMPEGWVEHPIGFYIYYTQSCSSHDKKAEEIMITEKSYQYSRVWRVLEMTDKPYSEVCIFIGSYFGGKKPTEFSDQICEHTLMARPSAAAKHFTHHYMDDTDGRSVNFTWEELDSCESHGIIRWYILNLTSATYTDSFKILGNLTSHFVGGLLWHQEYQAELYAVNDIGVSDKAVTIVSAVPDNLGWHVVLTIVFSSSLFLCVILSCLRLYFKVKKRVLPKIPEPSYYNKSFMTQMQYSQLLEPEVFDELRTCSMVEERAETSNSGEIPLIGATTTSQESDTHYPYSQFGSSFDSSPRTGSRDFAGLQAARPGNVQHNTYTSYPGSTSTPPAMEDGTSGTSDRKNPEVAGNEEGPDAGLDPYARFALLSEDEVFVDEREPASHHNECEDDDGYRGDGIDPLFTDSRSLLYSSVTEVSADDAENSPGINETNSSPRAYPSETLKEPENESSHSDMPLSLKNIPQDGKPSLTASTYQPRKDVIIPSQTSPCRTLLTPENEQMHSTLRSESEIPYTDIVNPQHSIARARGQLTGELNHPPINVTDKRGFETEEKVDSLSYVTEFSGSKFNDPLEQSESYSVLDNESNLRNAEEDPYISHTTQIAGSKPSDQTVKTETLASPCKTDLLPQADPYVLHPSTVFETLQIKPHISHDSGANRYNMNSNQALQPDPYVSHESAVTRSGQVSPSSQDPDVSQESVASGPKSKSCQGLQPDPYVSQESAATRSVLPNASSCDPLQPDPYVSQESAAARSALPNASSCDPLQPDPYVSHESVVTGSVQVSPSSQDPDVSQESVANGPKSKSTQGLQPDPYVSQEVAATRSALPNVSSCDPLQPDPYVSHESAVTGSGQVNPSSQDPHVSQNLKASGSKTKSCKALQPDPYVSHESAATGSTQFNSPSLDPYISQDSIASGLKTKNYQSPQPDPYVSHESATAGFVKRNPTSDDDPYIPHELGADGSNANMCKASQPDPHSSYESATAMSTQFDPSSKDESIFLESGTSGPDAQSCQALQTYPPDPYISHGSAAGGGMPQNPSLKDDPYISHLSGGGGSTTNTCHELHSDPYISHESVAAVPKSVNPKPNHDPYIPHSSVGGGSNTGNHQALQIDPYISHESVAALPTSQILTSEDDPHTPHLSGGGGSNTISCQALQHNPYVSHDPTTNQARQLNPSSQDDPYIS
ncbi:Interleukin-6 receptor subunit beta [Holothuria leucospilota]|uniref:Interleukin-6 receptor subunit beta n=1 Tax=Holothuria leucospilota TaxID=206669 RepID=A0A9Q1C8A8_HOLLE|nr:Interleukin-6 receptor subunit beta [Holothuria leucospilota]